MHVADELLRDRARATAVLAENLADDRGADGLPVHAVVLVEALVLDRDERLGDVPGQRLDRDAVPDFAADVADQRSVAREHARGLRELNDLPRFAGRGSGTLSAGSGGEAYKKKNRHERSHGVAVELPEYYPGYGVLLGRSPERAEVRRARRLDATREPVD